MVFMKESTSILTDPYLDLLLEHAQPSPDVVDEAVQGADGAHTVGGRAQQGATLKLSKRIDSFAQDHFFIDFYLPCEFPLLCLREEVAVRARRHLSLGHSGQETEDEEELESGHE